MAVFQKSYQDLLMQWKSGVRKREDFGGGDAIC